jgi:hypothetical protein
MENQPQHSIQEDFTLTPLTPEFNEDNHRSYVKRINSALQNQKIRNIALSGTYGVGKSSILQKVAEEHKKDVVEISLSTLAPIDPSEASESIPQQASTTTNRIQQEIVKQLLYRVESHNAPRSRFNRIESFNCKREHGIAALSGTVFTLLFLLMGWTEKIVSIHENIVVTGAWIHLIIFMVLAFCTLMARYLFQGRVNISQLSTGNAAISLDKKSVSYFDQYLDEIVYFFEVSEKNIVIFEDIDRFEDSYIFETLRSLNTLLNNAPQFKGKPIRFIYAIKDSIFDLAESNKLKEKPDLVIENPAQEAVQQTNRTKFFDLVIPVVPFITHRSARDLVSQILSEISHNIDNELINIAARYVPDMRLLKNVRNEFIVFREKLLLTEDNTLSLNDSELFAMMLYKSTNMSDFELIRLGKSKLDKLYQTSRQLVSENINTIENDIRKNLSNQAKVSANNIQKRSEDLGKQLIEHIEHIERSTDHKIENSNFTFCNENISLDHLKSLNFWEDFTSSKEPILSLETSSRYKNLTFNFRYSDLPKDFAVVNDWTEIEKKGFQATIDKKKAQLKTLRSAYMEALIKQPNFLVEHNSFALSFDAIARDILSNELAYQLLRSGYINDNFTLYTSIFHGDTVSTAATNFIIHNVQRNIMDEHLELTDDDVKAIIKESGDSALSEPCLYNISILNYLLKHAPVKADIMILSLIKFGDDDLRFLQSYLNGENDHIELVKKLTFKMEEILDLLINHIELDDDLRLTLANTVLENLNSELDYSQGGYVSGYLEEHYSELPVLLSSKKERQAKNIAKLYANAVIRVPELKPLSEQIRNAFITKDLYDINVDNLKIVLGNETNLALDVALEKNKDIYTYLLLNLGGYVQAVINTSKTISSNEYFIRVVEDVLALKNTRDLDNVVMHASGDCIIEDLHQVETDTWQCLAEFNRFTPTFDNISRYRSTVGEIDEYIEKVLIESDTITEYELATEGEKEKLAVYILHANGDFLTSEHIVQLVDSLNLTDYIHASRLPVDKGELFPLLLKGKIIEDCADTYEHLLETDWSTRESYIEASDSFKEYVTPTLLQGDLKAFLTSSKITLETKMSVVEQAEAYTENCDKGDLVELAQFAIKRDTKLPIDVVESMAINEVETKNVILLLSPHLTPSINTEQLFRILERLKGDYPKLISKGTDRPEIPNTLEDRKLIKVLEALQIISSFKEIADGFIKIFKKHK